MFPIILPKLILLPVLALMIAGCSTAHVHKEFQFDHVEGIEAGHESHERILKHYPTAHYDQVTLSLNDAKIQIALIPQDVHGTSFVGPILIPIIPTSFGNPDFQYASIDIDLLPTATQSLELQSDEVTLSFDGANEIKPSQIVDSKHLRFEFKSQPFPEQIKLMLNGLKINGSAQKPISLYFKEKSYWHYVPFVFMHTD